MMTADHVELQHQLLQCAGGRTKACEHVSSWIVQAIRPATHGKRTDAVLFGLCSWHKDTWREVVALLEYREGFITEWEALGMVLTEMRDQGWL